MTDFSMFLDKSISPIFHALAGCGRRCASVFHRGIGAFPVDTQVESQARASEQQLFIGDWPYHSILSATSWWSSGQI